jgi:hypothetical protein
MALPGGLVLLSPWSDLRHDLPSYQDNQEYDYISPFADTPNMNPVAQLIGPDLARATHPSGAADYRPLTEAEPLLSPVLLAHEPPPVTATLRRWPATYLSSGGDEILLDEQILLGAALARIGARALVHDVTVHGVHAFPLILPFACSTRRTRMRLAQFVARYVDKSEAGPAVAADAAAGAAAAPLVEAALLTDCEISVRGAQGIWLPRWKGIEAAKKVAWAPPPEQGTQVLLQEDSLGRPVLFEEEETAADRELVEEMAMLAEGVVAPSKSHGA